MDHQLQETTQHPPAGTSEMMVVEEQRAIAEVRASLQLAKMFPRDVNVAYTRIMTACRRKSLAEQAVYTYPKGGARVEGPSIRLAEAMAQAWGNMQFGIRELSQDRGSSNVEAYAWDVETNTRQVKTFQVKHVRHTKQGNYDLTDPRDIYEMTANQGARRLRACILGIIPGDIVDAAMEQIRKTLASGNEKPLADRIREMADAFGKDFSVDITMLEGFLGHKLEATSETEMVTLRGIYRSLKDGMGERSQYFTVAPEDPPPQADPKPKRGKKEAVDKTGENSAAVAEAGGQPESPPLSAGDDPVEIPPLHAESEQMLKAKGSYFLAHYGLTEAFGKISQDQPHTVRDMVKAERHDIWELNCTAEEKEAIGMLIDHLYAKAESIGYPQH